MANRNSAKINDGSLSDTQTYAEVKPEFSTYALWLKHSSTTASRLSEGDSLDSVSIVSSPGLSRNSKLIQSRETTPTAQQQGQNSRLNRSNSIRYALKLSRFQFMRMKSFRVKFLWSFFNSSFFNWKVSALKIFLTNFFVVLTIFLHQIMIQLSTRPDLSKVHMNLNDLGLKNCCFCMCMRLRPLFCLVRFAQQIFIINLHLAWVVGRMKERRIIAWHFDF